jgi:U3 small nucleolar RNA-associated protein 19
MKNKRKYDNPPPNANEVTKRNLNKLRKLSKPENPVATEIKAKAGEFLADRKNANSLIDIIGHLDGSEPASVALAAIEAIKRIVNALVQKNQIKQPSDAIDEESTEMKYRRWLWERIDSSLTRIAELMFHSKSSVSSLAVVTLVNILQTQNFSVEQPKAWDKEGQRILNLIVLSFCSNTHSSKVPFGRFEEFLMYGDVCLHFISLMDKIVAKVAKKEKASPVFVDNALNILESFPLPDAEKLKSGPNLLDKNVSTNFERIKRHYGSIWTNLVKCKFNVQQYKRSLIMLNEKVIPLLEKPILLADFLLGSFSVGGAISVLALSGVYTLISKYNLDYPDFYAKLYSLFQVEIFHVKYKARFFHLSDIFLASTHLPQTLVASFVKRIARMSLQAPADCLPLCIRFIYNLIHRHPGLKFLLDAPERSDLTSDPFLATESNPNSTKAMESSLWEIQTLTSHILPEVSYAAKELYENGIREEGTEKDISAVLEKTYSDFMDAELKKKIHVNVALNWEAPEGLKFAKNDFTSEVFEFS